jgi:BirA family biotin operon repressor/biotin-[acetyl-CoA-carboxylase] ligase
MISEDEILRRSGKTHNKFQFHIYDNLASTNDTAKEMIRAGGGHGSVIIANTQSFGHGRNKRIFYSPEGGIYVSFIFSESQTPNKSQFLTFAPCIAVCRAMERLLGLYPVVKWPNDILIDGGKACGILSETLTAADACGMIIGIGVNYLTEEESFPEGIRATAGSLKQWAKNLSRNEFIAGLVQTLDDISVSFTREQYLLEYKKRLTGLGNDIIVITRDGEIRAKAVDITEDGGLIIEKTNGAFEKLYAGDISIRGVHGQQKENS